MTLPDKISFQKQYRRFLYSHLNFFTFDERKEIRYILKNHFTQYSPKLTNSGHSFSDLIQIVEIVIDEIGLGKAAVLSVLFHELVEKKQLSIAEIETKFNTQVSSIIEGMMRVEELYERNT